jgi:hypothetical protein
VPFDYRYNLLLNNLFFGLDSGEEDPGFGGLMLGGGVGLGGSGGSFGGAGGFNGNMFGGAGAFSAGSNSLGFNSNSFSFLNQNELAQLTNDFSIFANADFMDALGDTTTRKDPYAREWFDRCGKYYYEGTGQALLVYTASEVPEGEQGNQCDQSKMMSLYQKYKCT